MTNIKFKYLDKETSIILINLSYKLDNINYFGNFILDTGSNTSVLLSEQTDIVELEILTIGGIQSNEKFKLPTSNTISISDVKDVNGVLGLDFLSNNIITINYKEEYIDFQKKAVYTDTPILSYEFESNYLLLNLTIENEDFTFFFDTGSSLDILFFENRTKNIKIDSLKTKQDKASSFSENDHKLITYEKDISINFKNCFQKTTNLKILKSSKMTDSVPSFIHGLIGNNFFINNTIIIDYINQKFIVE